MQKIHSHGESNSGSRECYSSHLTSSARGPFATFPHDHIPFTSDLLTSDPAGGNHRSSSSPPPLSFQAFTPSPSSRPPILRALQARLGLLSSNTNPSKLIYCTNYTQAIPFQITDPRPTLAVVNGQQRLPNPRQRTYLAAASPPTPSSWIFPED
jgi:hypothetical protein